MIRAHASKRIPSYLFVLLGIYCAASLIHFTHNAEFLSAYPNLPAWLTRSEVYLSWLLVTAVGVAGLGFLGFGFRVSGLLLIAGYAVLGFAGLDHYSVAPILAHTLAMNVTIWFEVVAAAVLLAVTVALVLRSLSLRRAVGA